MQKLACDLGHDSEIAHILHIKAAGTVVAAAPSPRPDGEVKLYGALRGEALTLLVCSSCHSPLADGTAHCPRCGPGSLALFSGEHLAPASRSSSPGREQALARALGRHYRVVRLLGQGGFAEVYEVRDEDLHRRLAVKVLRDDIPWSSATLARFKQEARAIARLSHPNTLPIHFVGEGEGLVFYGMPYCEGRTLAEILRTDGALSVPRALAIVEPILETLQHAHEHGLVHRDVKPDNILIDGPTGRPLLVDFGIVKYLDGPVGNTQTGFIVGTPLYMSPEQALGRQDVDARTDVYGVGVVLFQMITGAPPFAGADSQEIVTRHLHDPVPLTTLSHDRVPPWLSAVIVRCLAKHPDDRYPTARAVLDALRAGRGATPASGERAARSEDETPTAAMPRATRRPTRPTGRRRSLVGLGLVVAAGALWASVHPRPAPVTPPPMRAVPTLPTLLVHNRLTEPIALTLDDTGFTIGAGDSVRLPLRPGQALDAQWAMARPATTDGRMLGAALEGSIVDDQVGGDVRGVVTAASGGRRWFSPMVVNGTRRALTAVVAIDRDTVNCGCVIAPGDSLRLGYYRVEPGSQVRVRDPGGAVGRFDLASARIDSITGAAVFRVGDAALIRPRSVLHRVPPRQPARPRDPLKGFLPVR